MSSSTTAPFLQRIEGFTTIAAILIFFQAMYAAGLIPATLSAWEKSFGLTTSAVAPAITSYVIVKLIAGIPLTYYCSAGHIPKHLSWQFGLIGFTAILTALPWIMTTVEEKAAVPNTCFLAGNPLSAECSVALESNGFQYFVFIAQAINGFAASCLYTLVPAYIETNSSPKKAGKYLSYFLASGPLGVAFGFILQGIMVDAGLWGLTFILVGVCLMLTSILMFRMPKSMAVSGAGADAAEIQMSDTNEAPKKRRSSLSLPANKSMSEGLKAFAMDAKIVLSNGVWWFFALAASVEAFFVVGINNYGPKIFASYFSVSSGTASMIAGGLLVPAAVFGQIVGGVVDSKRSKSLNQTASFTKWIALVALISVVGIQIVQCDTLNFATREEATCGDKCNCVDTFDPVCVDGNEIHFNGCYSGCTEYDQKTSAYSNCTSCSGNNTSPPKTISHGACASQKCDKMPLMIVVFFLAVFFTFMNNPPSQMVMMRAVPPRLSANALALNDLCYRLIGSLPGVPIWAAMIDGTCVHRNKNACGIEAECGLYDNSKIAVIFLLLGAIPKLLSFIFFASGSMWLSKKMPELANKPYEQAEEDVPAVATAVA